MKVFINSVSKIYGENPDGSIDKNRCHESFINGQFTNEFEIDIWDPNCKIPENYKGKNLDLLITISQLLYEKEYQSFKKGSNEIRSIFMDPLHVEGTFILNYKIPVKWQKFSFSLDDLETFPAIETKYGIFPIYPYALRKKYNRKKRKYKIKEGERISFYIKRFNLDGWYFIEE